MAQKFEADVNLLKREIYDITKNIDTCKKRNHDTVSNFVKHLKKNFTFDQYIKDNKFVIQNSQIIDPNNYKSGNYDNENQSVKTEANKSLKYNNINKINKTKKYSAHARKFKNYYDEKSYKIINNNNFDYNSKLMLNSDLNKTKQNKLICNTTRTSYNVVGKEYNDIPKTYFNKRNNSTFNNKNGNNCPVKNNINYDKIKKIEKILNCNDIDSCLNKVEKYEKCYSFVEKIKNIYNNGNKNNDEVDLNKILYWVNDLGKQNKYECFCLNIMKKYNIQNFNEFQKIICGLMRHFEKEGYFLKDVKKLLFVENSDDINYIKKKNITNSIKRYNTEKKFNNENFEDIIYH